MKRLILALFALVLLALPAVADTISITVTSPLVPDAGNTRTRTLTISTADLQTVMAVAQSPCNVSINGTCTVDQVFDFITTWTANDWQSFVKNATTQTTTTSTTIKVQ
jgi:hypothetical protein